MPSTLNRGYPYPDANDAPNGPLQMQLLAEAVDADVDELMQPITWSRASFPSSWDANSTIESTVIHGVVHVRGLLRHDVGVHSTGSHSDVATLVAGHRPPATLRIGAVGWVAGGATPPYLGDSAIDVDPDGTITLHSPRWSTGVWVTASFVGAS